MRDAWAKLLLIGMCTGMKFLMALLQVMQLFHHCAGFVKKSLAACYTRCLCCVKTYCQDCDFQFHSWNVFHRRQLLFQDSKLVKLKPNEFWDPTLAEVVPPKCQSCLSINSLTIEPLKNKFMIVVTLIGNKILLFRNATVNNF